MKRKVVRVKGFVPPDRWRIQTWYNYKKAVFEPYQKPATDEDALAHMPQYGYVEPMYRTLRGQGFSILAAMRECFVKIGEMEDGSKSKQMV